MLSRAAVVGVLRPIYYRVGGWPGSRALFRPCQGDAQIAMYHRVLPPERLAAEHPAAASIAVSTTRFEEHLRHYTRSFAPIPIGELTRYRRRAHDGRPAIVLTFDDGYRDNLEHAWPLLRTYGVPAVVYVTSRFLAGQCDMWWLELPEVCERLADVEYVWQGHRHRHALDSPAARGRCRSALRRLLMSIPYEHQVEVMAQVRAGLPAARYPDLCLTPEQVRQLDRTGLVTIGAHGHTHARLDSLTAEAGRQDVTTGKQVLEDLLGHPVDHYAFPYGAAGPEEAALVAGCGFATAAVAGSGAVRARTDPWRLPRFDITERDDPERLRTRLSGWGAFWGRDW